MNPLHRRVGPECPSELQLDQLIASELPASRTEEVTQHLGRCATCQQRHQERLAERALFQELAPPLGGALPVAPAVAKAAPRRRFARFAVAAGALAAALALVPAVRHLQRETTSTKGELALRFFVLHGGVVREGAPGERVQPGDQLRFGLDPRAVAGRYAALFNRDAAGKVNVYFPDRAAPGALAARVPATEGDLLPYSIRLDEVLGTERLHLLLCGEPVALDPIQRRLEQAGPEPADWRPLLPASCTIESQSLEKQAGP